MNAAQLIAPIGPEGGTITLPNASHWMQGRTLYGGASALVAYTAAKRAFPDLPALRSAQIGFVGPVGEEVELHSEIVRQGRNVTQVRSDIKCQGQLVLSALWLFGADRPANARAPAPAVEDWPSPPQESERVMEQSGPSFIKENFELRRAQDFSGPGMPIVRRWIRLNETTGLDAASQAILMGDAMPPGAIRAMDRLGPISSINWSFNLLDPNPVSRDGWWLVETASQWADDGYSSERLRLWNGDGATIMQGQQLVAIFG